MRKGPHRVMSATLQAQRDLERLLKLDLFTSRFVQQTVRAYGAAGAEAAAVLVGAAQKGRYAEYLFRLDEGMQAFGDIGEENIEVIFGYISSLYIELGIENKS